MDHDIVVRFVLPVQKLDDFRNWGSGSREDQKSDLPWKRFRMTGLEEMKNFYKVMSMTINVNKTTENVFQTMSTAYLQS